MRIRAVVLLLTVALPSWPLEAQSRAPCANPIELTTSMLSDSHRALWRALTLLSAPTESGLFRSASLRSTVCADGYTFLGRWHTWRPASLAMAPVQASVTRNSTYPRSVNDGAAWNGVGFNLAVSAGLRGQWKFVTANLAPELYWQQNQDFIFKQALFPDRSEFANPHQLEIDYPSRFGRESFDRNGLGQSYVQVATRGFSATLGTENLWIGSADVYPILLSYTAAGFPHVRLGTQRPVDVKIGRVEFQVLFGSLSESDYFDLDPTNDSHAFATTLLVFEPRFAKGLFLGVARAYHDPEPVSGQPLSFFFNRIIESPFGGTHSGNRPGNAIGLLLGRWVLPESGFEAWGEWAREDTPGGWIDVLREPDWTQAYALGIQKSFASPARITRFYGELIHLGESNPVRAGRGFFSYYTHGTVTAGHTNRGQLLGAAIGPGSDAQLLGLDVLGASGRTAFRIERTRYDDDTYTRTFARRWGETRHNVEISLLASRMQMIGRFEVEGAAMFSRQYDRQWTVLPSELPALAETNWGIRLTVGWH